MSKLKRVGVGCDDNNHECRDEEWMPGETLTSSMDAVVNDGANVDGVAARKKAKRMHSRKNLDDLSDYDSEEGGTTERMTVNGGYAHTIKSKLRISKANKGNTPWNKVGPARQFWVGVCSLFFSRQKSSPQQ